jgi:hypothetical protein
MVVEARAGPARQGEARGGSAVLGEKEESNVEGRCAAADSGRGVSTHWTGGAGRGRAEPAGVGGGRVHCGGKECGRCVLAIPGGGRQVPARRGETRGG